MSLISTVTASSSLLSQDRFSPPKGWRWHNFTRSGRKIRFGSAFPSESIPDAIVVCFEGVGEFAEKYFEIARELNNHNLAFWIMDWMGQGKSDRYLPNLHKRHSTSFDDDIADMHYFILEYIKHSSVHPDRGRIPMALLAHSMGANISLRFLAKNPGMFECAAFSAPMVKLKVFKKIPAPLAVCATSICSFLMGNHYVAGRGDWCYERHAPEGEYKLSSDYERGSVHNAWCEADPSLKVGDVTYGWLHNAQKSCMQLLNPAVYKSISTPCFFGIAQNDHLVDGDAIRWLANNMPNAQYINIPDSYHEILMDKDSVRNLFLEGFYKLVQEKIIQRPETLKRF